MKTKRTTDLSMDVLYVVKSAEAGGGTARLTSWGQIEDVTEADQRDIRAYGWQDDFIREACGVAGDGRPGPSVWVCHEHDLAACQADASSGVYWTF